MCTELLCAHLRFTCDQAVLNLFNSTTWVCRGKAHSIEMEVVPEDEELNTKGVYLASFIDKDRKGIVMIRITEVLRQLFGQETEPDSTNSYSEFGD